MKSLYVKSASLFILFLALTLRIVQAQAVPVMHFECDDTSYRACFIAWHPENNWLAIRQLYRIQLWDNGNDTYIGDFMHEGSNIFLWTRDGRAFTTIGIGNILIRDPNDGTIIQEQEFGDLFTVHIAEGLVAPYLMGDIEEIVWSPNGSQLAFVNGHYLCIWNMDRSVLWFANSPKDQSFHRDTPLAIDWSPDGNTIALATHQQLILIDAVTYDVQLTLDYPFDLVVEIYNGYDWLAWSPDGRWLAVAAHSLLYTSDVRPAHVLLLNPENGEFETTFVTKSRLIYSLAWSPDGRWLATAGGYQALHPDDRVDYDENAVRIWDIETNKAAKLLSFNSPVVMVDWSADGNYLATSTFSGDIDIWALDLD